MKYKLTDEKIIDGITFYQIEAFPIWWRMGL